jgi:hypothetical protein
VCQHHIVDRVVCVDVRAAVLGFATTAETTMTGFAVTSGVAVRGDKTKRRKVQEPLSLAKVKEQAAVAVSGAGTTVSPARVAVISVTAVVVQPSPLPSRLPSSSPSSSSPESPSAIEKKRQLDEVRWSS